MVRIGSKAAATEGRGTDRTPLDGLPADAGQEAAVMTNDIEIPAAVPDARTA
jgi:hypothetical protein